MKWIAISLALMFPVVIGGGCATSTQAVGQSMKVQRVIEAQGSQDELYRLANEWMAKTFVESSEVIQYQDKEEGIIVGKGLTKHKYGGISTWNIWYTMTIEVKEDRARATIEDVYGEYTVLDTKTTMKAAEMRQKDYDELVVKFNGYIDDLTAYMRQGIEEW